MLRTNFMHGYLNHPDLFLDDYLIARNGDEEIRFKFNTGTQLQLDKFFAEKNTILYHPRQTMSTAFLVGLYVMIKKFTNLRTVVYTKDMNSYRQFIEKCDNVERNNVEYMGNINLSYHDKDILQKNYFDHRITTIVFCDEFEFLDECDVYKILSLANNKENLIVGGSTINKNFNKNALKILQGDSSNIESIVPDVHTILSQSQIENMRKLLDNEDVFRREVLLIRDEEVSDKEEDEYVWIVSYGNPNDEKLAVTAFYDNESAMFMYDSIKRRGEQKVAITRAKICKNFAKTICVDMI